MEAEGERAAGLRTHALSALLGAVWGAVANRFGGEGAIALGLAFVVFGAAIVLFRYRETSHDDTFGATTVVAAMLTFALGVYAVLGDIEVAAAAGLLALKAFPHAWVQRLTWPELRSGIREGLDARTGAMAIAIAVVMNTFAKTAFARFVGGAGPGWRLALPVGLAAGAGAGGLLFLPLLGA